MRSLTDRFSFPSSMHMDTRVESSDLGIAMLFNEFFFSVFTATSTSTDFLPSNDHNGNPTSILDDMEISVSDVFKCFVSLDVNKAMGIDGIPNYVLKFCSESLCVPIHHLFAQCVDQSYLPSEWRIHKIVPIYKSGDISSVNNYRLFHYNYVAFLNYLKKLSLLNTVVM